VESINYKNVLCIGPSGNSGRATACKSFIYNLLIQKINVSWKPIKIDSTTEGTSELDAKVTKVKNALLKYSEVVICSQPKNWNSLIDSNRISNDKTIIGKFSSDIDEINEENIAFINESKINILSVLNQEVFDKLNGRVNKTIIVEKLSYVVDKRSVDYKAFDNNEITLGDGWCEVEMFDNKMFRWTKPSFSIIFNKEIPYTQMRLELMNEFNDKKILILARCKNGLTRQILDNKYEVNAKICLTIDIKDIGSLSFHSEDCSSFGNDTRLLFLKFYSITFENENSIDTIPIIDLKTEQEARQINFVFTPNYELITDAKFLYAHEGKRSEKSFEIKNKLKTGIILYLENLSPKNLRCLDNLTADKHSKHNVPIVICSDADLEIPENYNVEFFKFEMPKLNDRGASFKDRYSFWSFMEFIKIADHLELDHFFGYEWDCKVGQDLWFDRLWDEFLSWKSEPIIAGTPVIRYPMNGCGNFLQATAEYQYQYSKECGLTMYLDTGGPHTLYCNGALTFYNTSKMKQYFAKELNYRVGDDITILNNKNAWDLEVGLRILQDVKDDIFNKVAWIPSSYSGFGDHYYNQRQRNKMLETGLKAAIHQYKY
jgi:hypothetical protein